ncbi:MAG: RNA polymerase sigma factor [Bacillota bacterium]|nr:RNA polymerase sigma factor [Bacillota bacterium]
MLTLATLVDESAILKKRINLKINDNLFEQIAEGNMDALETLYSSTERTLYAYLLSLTKDHNLAVDLLQETYIKVMGAAHLYQPQGKPMAWIFSIAKNLFLDELRKRNREVVVGETEAFDRINLSYEMHPENRLVLEAALAELAETERSIILLFSVSGLKHREIASLLNLNISTVLSKYHRGLKKLRTFLEEGGKTYEQ